VRGRSLVLDLAGAAAWALLLALAQAWLADPPASRIGLEALETGLPGAALGALLVVLVRRAARGRRPGRALALP
jgi:membrane protein DedA with SNARE-associated domain